MKNEREWWSEVEERFKEEFTERGGERYNFFRQMSDGEDILSFFHKEIQERLHEDSVDSELPK